MTNKLPVFFHIPKNAGTYVCDILWYAAIFHFTILKLLNGINIVYPRAVKKILVLAEDDDTILFHINLYDFPDNFFESNIFTQRDVFTVSCHLNAFLNHYKRNQNKDIIIHSATIVAAGFRLSDKICNILKDLTGRELSKFIILRDPLDRERSFYKYIKSSRSKHEKTHGSIEHESFSDYISSYRVADSWLIRELLNKIPYNEILTDNHYNACLNILNEFDVGIIDNVDTLINKVLMKCYTYDIDTIFSYLKIIDKDNFVNKNSGKRALSDLNDIDEDALNKFKERAKYDFMLYDYYSSK